MIDSRVAHLGDHQLGRCLDLLHAHGHVLDGVVFPFERELKLPITANAETDIR